tara:strand:+ start:2565 stop:2810 length:246 start_codon:yes stop_codon:yes gene_type:complete
MQAQNLEEKVAYWKKRAEAAEFFNYFIVPQLLTTNEKPVNQDAVKSTWELLDIIEESKEEMKEGFYLSLCKKISDLWIALS